ncbi:MULTISPECIES: MATE family efflux transporter [unclassified Butyrivibrio]|jgi:putative MATE family efflux protein|uniref:MATE family efflux transporter n=1 Tax=unclassified Butyrivibrio TaxID=2639466 RepID=UPI000421CF71|nr:MULTISPECIES: MATE family efflux transporter [unclassified Butyrivibrio]
MAKEISSKENIMGTEKINKLVITTGIPLMFSLLINSLYNLVDSVFVSRISEDALTALSLAGPVQLIVSSLGLGNAVGLNAVISKALGEKRPDKVKNAANAAIFIAVCCWIINVIICLLFVRLYYDWQAGGNETIARYGRQYLTICMIFSFGQMGQWVFDRFVIASGKSSLFIFTLSAASITNLILDPIFIFGMFGLPRLETTGAAIATVIGQCVGLLAGIVINKRWNKEIPFSFTFSPDMESVKNILKVGIPSTVVQVLTSFVNIGMNSILLSFSSTAVAVYGVCARMQNVVTVGVHGIDNGLIPIVAYNYGAGKRSRISDSVKWAVIYGVALFIVFFMILELLPMQMLSLFDASEHMMKIGVPAIRILATAYLISIPSLVLAAALQGLSQGTRSMYITMLRQAMLPLAFAFVLSRTKQISLVWTAFIMAELLVIPVALALWKKSFNESGIKEPGLGNV